MSAGTFAPELRPADAGSQDASARSLLGSGPALYVIALTVLAAVLRFWDIGHQGFWFDEANTALLVHFSPGKMLGLIPQTESTPPLYYCVAWVWARVFGHSEAPLRSLSALAGVAVVPVAYGAARKLISTRAGLVTAALSACNPFLIWYSQEARSYELLVLLTAASLLAFAYALEDPRPLTVGAWVLAGALALATHYYALLAIAPQAVWLLRSHPRRRAVQIGLGAAAACGLALVPLAISQNATGHASWIAPISLGPRLEQIVPQFVDGVGSPARGVAEPLAVAMVIVGLALLALRSESAERRRAFGAGALAVGGLALNLVLIAGGIDDLITRNVIVLWLPAAVMVAGGLGARRAGVAGIAATAVLCVTGIVATAGVARDRSLQRPDWRGVAQVLGARPQPGSAGRLILVQHYRDLLPLSLYLQGLRFVRHGGARVSELDVVSIGAPRVALCWWGAACNVSASRMQASYPVAGFHAQWRRRIYQFTILRMVASSPVLVSRQDLARVVRATTLARDELLVQR